MRSPSVACWKDTPQERSDVDGQSESALAMLADESPWRSGRPGAESTIMRMRPYISPRDTSPGARLTVQCKGRPGQARLGCGEAPDSDGRWSGTGGPRECG